MLRTAVGQGFTFPWATPGGPPRTVRRMERRTALAVAATAACTVLAASAAFAVNVGLLQHDSNKPVGVLDTSAIDASSPADQLAPTVVTVIVDDPPAQRGADATSSPGDGPVTATGGPRVRSAEVEHEDGATAQTGTALEHDDDD
jgi:hypothetical protein